jgi:hypothetical protein
VRSQEREHPTLRQQMTRHRLHVQDLPLWISLSLHPQIVPATPAGPNPTRAFVQGAPSGTS